MASRLGRFELRRELGQGAQASVWLAWDPQLEREVALKCLNAYSPAVDGKSWLSEARAVSRLTHPNIVPVFDVGEDEGRQYLVFEYVPGPTLSVPSEGMPATQVAPLMLGVLDGLAAAHAIGIVHRDLKPSNILLGSDGRPRVMDFGIASRLAEGQAAAVAGTPAYIAPEVVQGGATAATMDVYAAGLLMSHLLLGRHLRPAVPHQQLMAALAVEALQLPGPPALVIDDGLRSLIQRALAPSPQDRWPDAAALRDALRAWLHPPTDQTVTTTGGSGALDFLLRRMRHKSDFPALSDAVTRIQRVADSEDASLSALSEEVMKDVALTHKLLRLINAAHFRHVAGGQVNTVSRAVALVGFGGVRNLAISLVFLEHMQDKAHADRLKDVFLRALMSASLATALCPLARFSEEAFLVGMLHNLGRLLCEFYFPEEALRIRQQLAQGALALPVDQENQYALEVLGISYEDLGAGVAKVWGLSEVLQKGMRRVVGAPPRSAPLGTEALRWLGQVANDITHILLTQDPHGVESSIAQVAETYAKVLNLKPADVVTATREARQHVSELAQHLGIRTASSAVARRLLYDAQAASRTGAPGAVTAGHHRAPPGPVHDLSTQLLTTPVAALAAAEPVPSAPLARAQSNPAAVREALSAGVQEITAALAADNVKLDAVLQRILQILHEALGLQRVILALRDIRGECVSGRMGVGLKPQVSYQALRVPLKTVSTAAGGSDLFAVICLKGTDLLIDNARAPSMATRLPDWYRRSLDAACMLLLPLTVKQLPFGLLYADHAQAGGILLGEAELSLVKTLRNQAVMAFKSAGSL